jgi:hypothetical protein
MAEYNVPNVPQLVHVVNFPSAEDVYERIKKRAANIRASLDENEALLAESHAPTGILFLISDADYYAHVDDALLLVGVEAGTEEECQIIAPAAMLQIVFRVVHADRRPRKQIGFSGPKEEEDTATTT